MKKENKSLLFLFIRYIFLLILPISFLYLIFTPLTVYPSYLLLKIFYNASLSSNVIFISPITIEIIEACVAGAAYYFLLILNLSTPMAVKTRVKSLSFLIISFLIINILRISLFSILFVEGFEYFDFTHKLFWNLGSTILLVALWFLNIYLFKIKSIPAYSDFKHIIKLIRKI